jgi:hypothetical protein
MLGLERIGEIAQADRVRSGHRFEECAKEILFFVRMVLQRRRVEIASAWRIAFDPGVAGRQHFERRLGACGRIHVPFEYRAVRKFKNREAFMGLC